MHSRLSPHRESGIYPFSNRCSAGETDLALMHVNFNELKQGDWLFAGGSYARFIGPAADTGYAELQPYGKATAIVVPLDDIRPVYINEAIIIQCGFKKEGAFFRDAHFEISAGGRQALFKIIGHRIKKPYANHLLSQLHIFQGIYRNETGHELSFRPF